VKNWKETLILPDTSIRKAIQRIDESTLQIALVVDENRRLLGTITDGDVRRAILRAVTLDESVRKIMQTQPITARSKENKENILLMMKQKGIHQVPLLDHAGRVTGIEVIDKLMQAGVRENWVLLMAGGLGTRLRPLTNDRPKPLLHVGSKPILETILENFIEYGFRKFFISVNYKNEMIREHFGNGSRWSVEIHYLKETERLGTAGALSLLPKKPSLPLIVMNGDLLTKINWNQLLAFHQEHEGAATMCVREYDFQVPYGVVQIKKHQVAAIDEKPVQKFFVNAGIYVFESKVLKPLKKNKPYDMPYLFEKLIQQKSNVAAFPIREYWLDIGRLDDLERANGEFASMFR